MTDLRSTENAAPGGTCEADCSADAFDPEEPVCTNCGDPMELEPGWEWPEEPELCVCHGCAHILFEELWREKQNSPQCVKTHSEQAHAPDCAIALNGRHACSCMPNSPQCVKTHSEQADDV